MLFSPCHQVHIKTNFSAVITIDKLIWYFTRLYTCPTEVLKLRPTQLNHTTHIYTRVIISMENLHCFLHNHENIAQEVRDYALLLSNNFKGSL